MIPDDSRHIPLRGVLGHIVGEGIQGRHTVQLNVDTAAADELTAQLVEMAFEIGLYIGPNCVVIPTHNRLMVLKAKRAYKDRGVSSKKGFLG